jgi:hypothetical protein
MPVFDRRLVRPSVLQLVECLQEASAVAGVSRDHEGWQAVVDGIRNEPEGFRQEGTLDVVTVAWWTDYLQRRHFRVQACGAGKRSRRLVVWKEWS